MHAKQFEDVQDAHEVQKEEIRQGMVREREQMKQMLLQDKEQCLNAEINSFSAKLNNLKQINQELNQKVLVGKKT